MFKGIRMKYKYNQSKKKLTIFEESIEKTIGTEVSSFIINKDDKLIYLDNTTVWHNGNLYLYEERKEPVCIAKNVRVELVTDDLNYILFLENYDSKKLSGDLFIFDNTYSKMLIDTNVYTGISFLDNKDGTYRVFYTKRNKQNSSLCDVLLCDNSGVRTVIDKDINYDYKFFMEIPNKLKFIYFKPEDKKEILSKGTIYIYEDNKELRKFINSSSEYTALRDRDDCLKLVYYTESKKKDYYGLVDVNIYRENGETEKIPDIKEFSIKLFRTENDKLIFAGFKPKGEINYKDIGDYIIYDEEDGIFNISNVLEENINLFLKQKNRVLC